MEARPSNMQKFRGIGETRLLQWDEISQDHQGLYDSRFILFYFYIKKRYLKQKKKITKLLCIIFAGGDPTGTGKGGVSIYGECFDDEIHDDLKHTGN